MSKGNSQMSRGNLQIDLETFVQSLVSFCLQSTCFC